MTDVFLSERKKLEKEAQRIKKRILEKKTNYPDLTDYVLEKIRKGIKKAAKKILRGKIFEQDLELRLPPPHIRGDLALTTFALAKKHKIDPQTLAEKFCWQLNKQKRVFIKRAVRVGAFVNIELEQESLYLQVIWQVLNLGQSYGRSHLFGGQLAVIEYSSPNIAKPIGVGHLRSTIIGQALANIYEAAGFRVIRENYLGDWGSQFGKLLYAYQKWGKADKIAQNPIAELKKLYVKFHKKERQDPKITQKAAQLARQLEVGSKKVMGLWQKFRKLSVEDFKKTYQLLGVNFDLYTGESYFVEDARSVIEDCLKKGLCKKEAKSGLVAVESLGGLPSFLLRKADGATLYLSRDLALLKFRVNFFKPRSILYVVGQEQELNFKQLFALARKLGYLPEGVEARHIKFGLVLAGGQKMATRKGTTIAASDLISKAIEKVSQIIKEKNPAITAPERVKIAKIVGIGAVIYNDLKQGRQHSRTFDWQKMLNFEAGSAPYLQYTAVRIKSILRNIEKKLGRIKTTRPKELVFEEPSEFALAKKIMLFPQIVLTAQATNDPHNLCVYLEELAQAFNTFYTQIPIIKTKDSILRASRIMLIRAVLQALQNGLDLLNVKIPLKM